MRVERELAATAGAAAEARHALDSLPREIPDGRLHDVRLLVSEVVTNAVRHARLSADDSISLVLDLGPDRLRVEVRDPGGGFTPAPPSPTPGRASGWGLYLVSELSDRWGVQSGSETLVWFELDRAPAPFPIGRRGAAAAA